MSTLACFTKRAKCMTLSVLETSLPSHDTLALDISALNLCLEASLVNHVRELNSPWLHGAQWGVEVSRDICVLPPHIRTHEPSHPNWAIQS